MLDPKQLKLQGLRYARSMQVVYRMVVMFSIDYPAVKASLEQSYKGLNDLLKAVGQFTLGFVDQQIMLNQLLTRDQTLSQLENEFLKRGIAAVTFEGGVTAARYKRTLELLATPAKVIDEKGGVRAFFQQNSMEGIRVHPVQNKQRRTDTGDTILGTDSESYLLSKQIEDLGSRDFTDSLDMLLESAGLDETARLEVVATMKTRGLTTGTRTHIPNATASHSMDFGTQTDETSGEHGGTTPAVQTFSATTIAGAQPVTDASSPRAAGNGSVPHGSVPHGGLPNGGLPNGSVPQGTAPSGVDLPLIHNKLLDSGTGGGSLMDIFHNAVERALSDKSGDPEKSYVALARLLRNLRPDLVLSHFPVERQSELRALPPDELAGEFIEDIALKWSQKQLSSPTAQANKVLVEEEVVNVLVRSLQAVQSADRLARKLAQYQREYMLPDSVYQKMQDELRWIALPPQQKHTRLLAMGHFDALQFRRLAGHLKELFKEGKLTEAMVLATRYFNILEAPPAAIQPEALSRGPELIRMMTAARAAFPLEMIDRLGQALQREDLPGFIHYQIANCLAALSQSLAKYEDFDQVEFVGSWLEKSMLRRLELHQKCCQSALSTLLPATALERLIELYLSQKNNSSWAKKVANLVRRSGSKGIDKILKHLETEATASNRLALLRLVTQVGPSAIEVARQRLSDTRWYVVRNACFVLGELRDPELLQQLTPVLCHPDKRVQQAAVNAVIKSRIPSRGSFLAGALPQLGTNALELALEDLIFLRDPATLSGLEGFVLTNNVNSALLKKAVHAIAALSGNEALAALANITSSCNIDISIRRLAMSYLADARSEITHPLLVKFIGQSSPNDPLVSECQEKFGLQDA